ncbi:MAG: leucine-rich repeat protein [Clostridia bacterium]|nr:leucine-rich repeat protein [Clostridia bacterium]
MSKKSKNQIPLNEKDKDNIQSKLVDSEIHLDIPEDEIWTYRVEGLAAPHINKPYKYYTFKKIVFAVVIIIAVSLSMYFSVRTVQKDTFEYEETSIGTELSKYSNTGYMTVLDIDYVSHIEYDRENPDVNTNFTVVKDKTKKIVSVGPYALNCDEKIQVINISADVVNIDPKAFYSCWALQRVEIDENNPNYCDVDGVIYNKDMTELIFVPCDHDTYRAEKYGHAEYDENGFRIEPAEDSANFEQYRKDVLTYVVPSSVKTIGQLAFNYANMTDVYLPEGVTVIETLGFFEIPRLANIYSYKSATVTDTHFTSEAALGEVYLSLPEGLEYIGSDCFSYNQAMTYVYIPESVTYIGHHAFWDTCYKQDGEIKGVNVINVAADEETFKDNVHLGDSWRPQYDYLLFKKSIDVNYSAQREAK